MTHLSVLKNEVIHFLDIPNRKIIIDATLGLGGHSLEIFRQPAFTGKIIGLDQDKEMLHVAASRLNAFGARFQCYHKNFRDLAALLIAESFHFDGILFDLGVASPHFDEADRGFTFQKDSPLDMRLDREKRLTAADIVNRASERELSDIFFKYGEEFLGKMIAKKIVEDRGRKPITTTRALADIVEELYRKLHRSPSRHNPATRVFQALRIAVNDELAALQEGLEAAIERIDAGGRIVVISYHSLEDRIVKTILKKAENPCLCPPKIPQCICGKQPLIKILTKKPITPLEEEIHLNPRARSAKLRVAERF